MAEGAHDHVFDLGVGVGPVVLRVALLAAVPLVAGFALLRGFLPRPGRTTATWVVATAGGVVLLELLLAGGLSLPAQVVPLLLGAVAAALYAVRSADPRFATLRRTLRGVAPLVVVGTTVLAVIEFVRGWRTGDAVALHTGVLLAMVGLAWFLVCAPRGRTVRLAVNGTAAVLAIALVGSVAQAIVLRPRTPVPGVATAAAVAGTAVTIVPNLPGWNLVHVAAGPARVGAAPDRLTTARPRPGSTGSWAAVWLRPGRGELWVRHGGALGSLRTDTGTDTGTGTGTEGTAPAELFGQDGPECASTMLGAVLGAGAAALPDCPSTELNPTDAAALAETVRFLADRGHRTLTVVGDHSPRGRAAVHLIETAAAAAGMDVGAGPTLVVAGWPVADRLPRSGGETYLAPWLHTAPPLAGTSYVTRWYDPTDPLPRRYALALARGYPGELPSATGYRAWLAGQRETETGTVHIHPTEQAEWLALSP